MIKAQELTDPQSCMSRARDDELTFVLLGRDAAAPVAIRAWIHERIRLGKNRPDDSQILSAEADAAAIEAETAPAPTNEREYICGYCLSVSASSSGPPKECEHCKMGYCRKCGARLKVGMKWCYGCGAIPPEVMARFCNTESTGSVYMAVAWAREGLPHGQVFRYGISAGYRIPAPETGDRMGVWLTKDGPDGQHIHERELTDEERVSLGYGTRAESLARQEEYDVKQAQAELHGEHKWIYLGSRDAQQATSRLCELCERREVKSADGQWARK